MPRINVSSIHLGQRCPRLLAYQLRGEADAWRSGLTGQGQMPGSLFHDEIAAPLHSALAATEDNAVQRDLAVLCGAPQDAFELGLLAIIEKHFFLPLMQRRQQHFSADQILQLGHGLFRWCKSLAEFLQPLLKNANGKEAELFRRIFFDPEHPVTAVYQTQDGRRLEISGRYDALLFDPGSAQALLIEYKGRISSHQDEDFLQLVLYAWLIREATGITPNAVLLHLEDDEAETRYAGADLEKAMKNLSHLFEQVVAVMDALEQENPQPLAMTANPNLCALCLFDNHCDADWGRRPRQGHCNAEPDAQEAGGRMQALVDALQALKLPVDAAGFTTGPRFIRLKIVPQLERGVTVRKLCNQAENLQVALRLGAPPLIQAQAGHVSVDVPRQVRVPLTLGEVWRKGLQQRPDSQVAFPVGMGIEGDIVWADLGDPTMTSILVGGTAGSGKSMFLKAAVVALALNMYPSRLNFSLIDPKRVSFLDLAELPHLHGPLLLDLEPAIKRLEALVDEMEGRYRLFEEHSVHDIRAYHEQEFSLPHHVIVIDEYADLMIDRTTRERLEAAVVRLAQKGRAAGMHLILATQRPDSKIITPLIKANLQLKVALKVTSVSNSRVILDERGAEYLVGNGDMLIGGSVPLQRLQGPLVTRTDIEQAMRNTNKH